MPARQKAKPAENKSTPEKAVKTLSPKKQIEADHLAGKHKENDISDCAYCNRRTLRYFKKQAATKRYLLSNQK